MEWIGRRRAASELVGLGLLGVVSGSCTKALLSFACSIVFRPCFFVPVAAGVQGSSLAPWLSLSRSLTLPGSLSLARSPWLTLAHSLSLALSLSLSVAHPLTQSLDRSIDLERNSSPRRASMQTSVREPLVAMRLGCDRVELVASEHHQLRCHRPNHRIEPVPRVVDLGAARRIEHLDRMQHEGHQHHAVVPSSHQRLVRAVQDADHSVAMLASSELEPRVRS